MPTNVACPAMPYPQPILTRLQSVYEEMIWLANRPHVTPQQARAWYSGVMARTFARELRMFTGFVSRSALLDSTGDLVLEHYDRLSYELSRLLRDHHTRNISDSCVFVQLIERCERVNITTGEENDKARKARGNYDEARIQLVPWQEISRQRRGELWRAKLQGQVANAAHYVPANDS